MTESSANPIFDFRHKRMSVLTPEAKARQQIDRMLADAGWVVQDRAAFNPAAGTGIAVREFPLKTGFADYLLLVDRMAVGAVEAKKVGTPLSGVESQSAKYSDGLPDIPPAWRKPLPFLYESTGVETFFTNGLDPDPRSNVNLTLRKNPLTESMLADFIAGYNPENRHDRLPTWSEQTPEGRWRRYSYEELVARDKANLDIFWLRDEGIDDGDALLEPDALAAAIVEDLAAALEQFRKIVADLEDES
ncbi:MAG: hypothetical protein H6640_22845 [Caldilineaceae bacterium]|nr:hypothetical protein [Caldilineaceae bacterium]